MFKNKNLFFFLALACSISMMMSCGNDDGDPDDVDPNYSVQIMMPTNLDKNLNDDAHIHVNFDAENDETIHHVKVRIYEFENETNEVYNAPGDAHVHEESGHFEHHADIVLNNDLGVVEHSDWVLEAKVWGHEAGTHEAMDTIHFHIHPE